MDSRELRENPKLFGSVVEKLVTPAARQELRIVEGRQFSAVWTDPKRSRPEKISALAPGLLMSCANRGYVIARISCFDETMQLEVVHEATSPAADPDETIDRLCRLVHVAILASAVTGGLLGTFRVVEQNDAGDPYSVTLSHVDLQDWIAERAGLYDLLDAADCFLGDDALTVEIDFAAIREAEMRSLGSTYPRRWRDGS